MDLSQFLAQFTPDQLVGLKTAIDSLTDVSGRSPFRPRQLHDLTLLPTKDDPRPTFFWSAEKPRNAGDLSKTQPYPRLMWESPSGREITVHDAKAQATYTAQGFLLTPPANAEAPDALELIRLQLEALSPEDRATLVQAAQKDRLGKLQEQVAMLSEEDLAALAASLPTGGQKRRSA